MDRTTHPFTPEEVMAYLDGELSAERATAAAAHLEHCSECRDVAADLRGVSRQLAGWQVEAVPQSLAESAIRSAATLVTTPIREESTARKGRKTERKLVPRSVLWWSSAFAVAALVLIAVSLPTMYRPIGRARQAQRDTGLSAPTPTDSISPLPPATSGVISAPANRVAQNARSADKSAATAMMMKDLDAKAAYESRSAAAPAAAQQMEMKKSATGANGPMIIRRASLGLLTKEFDSARAAMENLVRAHQGYFGQLNVATPANAGRSLTATVRVPAAQLDPVLVELRKLGRVEQENQTADDVTGQYVDLKARLGNAQETEKRLVEILRERTGKVADVLDVEREIASVRGQIEQMDAQRKTMENQVQYASVDLRITEEYKQSLDTPAPALGTRIHNAAVDGFLGAADLVIGLLLFSLNAGPSLMLLAAMFAWPVWRVVSWLRRRYTLAAAASQSA